MGLGAWPAWPGGAGGGRGLAVIPRDLREGSSEGPGKWEWVALGVHVPGVGWLWWLKWESPNRVVGALDLNGVPAVTYSPTPSRVQYHRRCGS